MERPMLTNEQVARYIAQHGVVCPYCGERGTIEGGAVEVDAGYASQRVGCSACNETWDDLYTLTGVGEEEG
jgi:hypothetical protein